MKNFLLFIIALVFIILILVPKSVLAEIATTRDWIGLFPANPSANCDDIANKTAEELLTLCRGKTVNGTSWGYPSKKDANGICAQTPGTTPKLSDSSGCRFTPSPFPIGTYEYRMYAYDRGDPAALIAKSKPITVGDTAPPPGGGTGLPCPKQTSNPRVKDGLISAPDVGSNFGNNQGQCINSNQASFAPYKIPSYEDLFSLYYTQSKASTKDPTPHTGTSNQGTLRSAFNDYDVIWINSSLTIDGSIGGTTKTAVVFVNNDLNIRTDFTFGDNNNGIVFVVKGDVNIDKDVDQIDAVIISQGIICTAYNSSSSSCLDGAPVTPRLVIYGSLISINQTDSVPILFRRKLGTSGATNDNTTAAEQINNQPKYLVILRNLMSNTLQKWSEIQ